jgi:hypothetical protein
MLGIAMGADVPCRTKAQVVQLLGGVRHKVILLFLAADPGIAMDADVPCRHKVQC